MLKREAYIALHNIVQISCIIYYKCKYRYVKHSTLSIKQLRIQTEDTSVSPDW